MQMKTLGNTDILISRLGLGTVKLGRNQGIKYPNTFELPTDREVETLLETAADLNINLLDTAPAYGNSEERLGKLLRQRDRFVIGTKVGEEFIEGKSHFDFSKKHTQFSIERSLKRLKTDYLDIVLVHSNGDDLNIIEHSDAFETLESLKQKGLIRAFGLSSKTVAGGLLSITRADVAMITYNPSYTEEKPVLEKASELNKGILIKKALASGHLDKLPSDNPIQYSLEFILKEPAVSSIILGTLNPKHLAENAVYFAESS